MIDHVYFVYFMHALNFIPVGIYLKQFSLFELYFKICLIFKTHRCKGFFNRMVQNKRFYTCVAECNCQYCQHHPDSEALYCLLCSSARSVIVRTDDLAAAVAAPGHHQQPNDPPAGLSNGTPHHRPHHCPSSVLPPTPQQQQHNSHKVQQHQPVMVAQWPTKIMIRQWFPWLPKTRPRVSITASPARSIFKT